MSKEFNYGTHSIEVESFPFKTISTAAIEKDIDMSKIDPNLMSRINKHSEICNKLHSIYIKKNNDYGNSVSDTYKKFGMVSFLVRMQDKLNRVHSLTSKTDQLVADEQIEDTLLDLANYAILAAIELSENR